jgi:broad specificity phosphatase PhoE
MLDKTLIVHLVRHGETALNAARRFLGSTDVELSERGRLQAQAVAGLLAQRPLAAVHTSPLARARQTAELIAKARGVPLVERPGLAELRHGELEVLPYTELALRYPELVQAWLADPSEARLPGGETLSELQARAWPAFEQAAAETEGELCVVSHRMALVTIVCRAVGLPLREALRLELDLGSVSTLELRPRWGWRLLRLNAVHHLP